MTTSSTDANADLRSDEAPTPSRKMKFVRIALLLILLGWHFARGCAMPSMQSAARITTILSATAYRFRC